MIGKYTEAQERLWTTTRGRWALLATAVSILMVGLIAEAIFSDTVATILAVGYIFIAFGLVIQIASRIAPNGRSQH